MGLISTAFKEPVVTNSVPGGQGGVEADPQSKGFESTEQSSPDATLSELRHQETPGESRPTGTGKAPKRKQRKLTRGVPMKKELF